MTTRPRSRPLAFLIAGLLVLLAASALLTQLVAHAPGAAAATAVASSPASGPLTEGVPHFAHVINLMFENKSRDEIWYPGYVTATLSLPPGSAATGVITPGTPMSNTAPVTSNTPNPYLNSLVPTGAFMANYFGQGHFSDDNYIAATSGQSPNITTNADCPFYALCLDSELAMNTPNGYNITDQLTANGYTWKAYMDGMPAPCTHASASGLDSASRDPYVGGDTKGNYADRHDPFIYYPSIEGDQGYCETHVVPITDSVTSAMTPTTGLLSDLQNNQMPNYAWITPDTCNDAHDTPNCYGHNGGMDGLQAADRWLQNTPAVQALLSYVRDPKNNAILYIVFDESDIRTTTGPVTTDFGTVPANIIPVDSEGCCSGGDSATGQGAGGLIGALAISSLVSPGTASTVSHDQASLLRTEEDAFNLPYLNNAGSPLEAGHAIAEIYATPATTAASATPPSATTTASATPPSTATSAPSQATATPATAPGRPTATSAPVGLTATTVSGQLAATATSPPSTATTAPGQPTATPVPALGGQPPAMATATPTFALATTTATSRATAGAATTVSFAPSSTAPAGAANGAATNTGTPTAATQATATTRATATPFIPSLVFPTPLPPQALSKTSYIAGGYDSRGEPSYINLVNPHVHAVVVHLTFTFSNGSTHGASLTVPPLSQTTTAVHALNAGRGAFAFGLTASSAEGVEVQLTLSRPGRDGDSLVSRPAPSKHWYLAEGYTGLSFHEQIALLNPNASGTARVSLMLAPQHSAPRTIVVHVPAHTQVVENVDALVRHDEVGVVVSADKPIVVARRLTFGQNQYGLTANEAIPVTAKSWLFAEGSTVNHFQTFLTVLNPGTKTVSATATFYGVRGVVLGHKTVRVASLRRATIVLNSLLHAQDVASTVVSNGQVVVERPEYIGSPNGARVAGTNVFGITATASRWTFTGGATTATSVAQSEFLELFNPGARAVTVRVAGHGADGKAMSVMVSLTAHGRVAIETGRVFASLGPTHGLTVVSNEGQPFVAEQIVFARDDSSLRAPQGVTG